MKNAPNGSFFLLHVCAHNPTGVDPTEEQWKEISHQFKVKGHFAFFDMAYQGFASGDPEKDAKSIRIFLENGHLIGCAQYAKNMGFYGQRVGCLSVVCEDEKQVIAVKSQLQQIPRPMYSNPPVHGALIISTILGDPDLKKLWLKEVKGMAERIIRMRTALQENLENLGSIATIMGAYINSLFVLSGGLEVTYDDIRVGDSRCFILWLWKQAVKRSTESLEKFLDVTKKKLYHKFGYPKKTGD